MEKHLTYFELEDAVKMNGCPICELSAKRLDQYFDDLLYENVNNPALRQQIRKAGGFCKKHAEQLLRFNDGLGFSLIYESIFSDALKKESVESGDCPACSYLDELENRYLTFFVEYLKDPEFKKNILKSKGLCIPHFKKIMRLGKKVEAWYKPFQLKIYAELLNDLKQYIDDCNFSPNKKQKISAPSADNTIVWRSIFEMLYGKYNL